MLTFSHNSDILLNCFVCFLIILSFLYRIWGFISKFLLFHVNLSLLNIRYTLKVNMLTWVYNPKKSNYNRNVKQERLPFYIFNQWQKQKQASLDLSQRLMYKAFFNVLPNISSYKANNKIYFHCYLLKKVKQNVVNM